MNAHRQLSRYFVFARHIHKIIEYKPAVLMLTENAQRNMCNNILYIFRNVKAFPGIKLVFSLKMN